MNLTRIHLDLELLIIDSNSIEVRRQFKYQNTHKVEQVTPENWFQILEN